MKNAPGGYKTRHGYCPEYGCDLPHLSGYFFCKKHKEKREKKLGRKLKKSL